jgi:hypothetical protein
VTLSEPQTQFCSIDSLEAAESLLGTAPRADVWFMLEYSGRWGNQALKESSIPDAVKEHLNAELKKIPESRLLLVKRPVAERSGITFAAAAAAGNEPVLYRFTIESYEDLLGFDLAAIAAGDARYASALSSEPMFLICTNGLRDQCCALHGMAVYAALSHEHAGMVWESTHHGGHRFAANMLHLPYGLSYGRLRADSAAEVVQAALDGNIAFDYLRGRSTLGEAAQSAEAFLRRELALPGLNGLAFIGSQEVPESEWAVSFTSDGGDYTAVVARQETGAQVHASCGDEKTNPVAEFSLVEIKTA